MNEPIELTKLTCVDEDILLHAISHGSQSKFNMLLINGVTATRIESTLIASWKVERLFGDKGTTLVYSPREKAMYAISPSRVIHKGWVERGGIHSTKVETMPADPDMIDIGLLLYNKRAKL